MIKLTNPNYCATVIEIKNLVPLEGCDFVQAAIIMGNQVIVSKEVKIGDLGLFFPVECQLTNPFLKSNNLYRKSDLNLDSTKTGYFEENGRIRCVKFIGNKSEGLFMPIGSINNLGLLGTGLKGSDLDIDLKVGDEFNEIFGIEICRKYIIPRKTPGQPGSKQSRSAHKQAESKLIENQFRFHADTSQLYKNIHKVKPESLISITYKLHGTSGVSSRLLCKKKLNWFERLLKVLKVSVVDTTYDNIYSSRKVIKNPEINKNAQHYYNTDIWGLANSYLQDYLLDGMTLYYEIVGYLPTGGMIQENFDYGYKNPLNDNKFEIGVHCGIYIYRITYTSISGKVFEFSAKQVQDWCNKNGLNPVPELYYGFAKDIAYSEEGFNDSKFGEEFLEVIKQLYNEKDCYMCTNKVPEEGVVVRIEGLDLEAYKCKSTKFLEYETKSLDKGTSDIESEN